MRQSCRGQQVASMQHGSECAEDQGACARRRVLLFFFFFNDTATTEIYTLSLQRSSDLDARQGIGLARQAVGLFEASFCNQADIDRKSTRLNSSHLVISYAVFCLKKK